jgi:hypothetical protein
LRSDFLRFVKIILAVGIVAVVAFAAAQFGDVEDARNKAVPHERSFERVFNPPEAVMGVLRNSCFDCHSHQTRWPWYSRLPVIGAELERDVIQARLHMNFSDWERDADASEQADLIAGLCETVKMRLMPLPRYLLLHPFARVSDADARVVCEWSAKAEAALLHAD